MKQSGILTPTGHVNVQVVSVIHNGSLIGTYLFTKQFTESEAQQAAVELHFTAYGKDMPSNVSVKVTEHEVVDRYNAEGEQVGQLSTHQQFVEEIHGVVAAWRNAVRSRFGLGNGKWYAILNGAVNIAQSDLIDESRVGLPGNTAPVVIGYATKAP